MQTNTLIAVLLAVGLIAPGVACLGWFWYAKGVRNGFAEGQWIARMNRDRAENINDVERGHLKGPVWVPKYTNGGWCRAKVSDSIPLRSPEYVYIPGQRRGRPNSDQRFEGPSRNTSSPHPKSSKKPAQQPNPLSKRQQKKQRALERKKQTDGQNQNNSKATQQAQDRQNTHWDAKPERNDWVSNKQNDWEDKNVNQSQKEWNGPQQNQDNPNSNWNAKSGPGNWSSGDHNKTQDRGNNSNKGSAWGNKNDNNNHNNKDDGWGNEAKGKEGSKIHGNGKNNGNGDGHHSGRSYHNGFVNNLQKQQTTSWVQAQSEPNNEGYHHTSVQSNQPNARWSNKGTDHGSHYGNARRNSGSRWGNGNGNDNRRSSRNRSNNKRGSQRIAWGQSKHGNWDTNVNEPKGNHVAWSDNNGAAEEWGENSHSNHNGVWSQDDNRQGRGSQKGWRNESADRIRSKRRGREQSRKDDNMAW